MKVGKWASRPLKLCTVAVLMTALIGTGLGASAGAASSQLPSDIKGNWAESVLKSWYESGWLKGDSNGKIEPNRPLTRAEWMALANRALGYDAKAEVSYKDLSSTAWEYDDVRKAVKAGYVAGYEDGTIRTKNKVSRQEAAVMLARILKLDTQPGESAASQFTDEASIASWSRAAVRTLAGQHLVSGYADGSFKPQASITRAEAVVLLDNAVKAAPASAAATYDKPGVYGSAAETINVQGDVIVSAAGVTLQNMNISGKLILAAGIGEGDVNLKHVTVSGYTEVQGGGGNSIHVSDSMLAKLIVEKQGGDGPVRIVAEGSTVVAFVSVQSSAVLEEAADLAGEGFTSAELANKLPAGSTVTLKGHFDSVQVYSVNVSVNLPQGTVDRFAVDATAQGLTLTLGTDAKIVSLILDAVVQVLGQGVIETAILNDQAQNSTFERQPDKIVNGGTDTSSGGSTPGGGGTAAPILTFPVVSDTHVGIEDVSVDAAAKFTQALKVFQSLANYNAIVVDGDMTDAGTVAQYESAMSILDTNKPQNAKAIIVPGNHEYYAANDELGGDKYAVAARFYEETGMNTDGYHAEAVNANTENAGVFYDTWVRGYHFIVMDHDRSAMSDAKYEWLKAKISTDENGNAADPKKPVFVLTHYPYKNTTYGSESAGWNNPAEYAKFKAVMADHPNAILFTGHTHYTLNHPNTLNADDGFIRVNDGATSFVQARGYGNDDDIYLDKAVSQGLLVKVYSNQVVIERRELDQNGAVIGDPYVIDLNHPVESAKKYSTDAANPAFNTGAKVTVSAVSAVSATLAWPKATDDTKVDSYIVTANGKLIGAPSVLYPYAEAASHTFVAKGLTPNTEYTVSIQAIDAYGKKSAALTSTFKTLSAPAGYDSRKPDVLDIDFTNVSGNTAKDATLNANNAVLENHAKVEDDFMFGKQALVLDGAGARGAPSSVARVKYNSSLFKQDALTIETAFYLSPDSDLSKDEYHILGNYENGGYYLYYSAEDRKFVFDTENSDDPAESDAIPNVKGKIYYLTAVYDGDAAHNYANGTIKLYVNGVLAGTNRTSGPLPINESNDLIIGGDAEAYGDVIHYFEGAIGQAKIYSRSLESAEITDHYAVFKSSLPIGSVQFYATSDAAVPQKLREYAQVLAGTKTIDYTFSFQTSALAVLGQRGDVNVIDKAGYMWTGSGQTLKRFDPYASGSDATETFAEGAAFKGTIKALLADDYYLWVLTDQNVSRIRYQ